MAHDSVASRTNKAVGRAVALDWEYRPVPQDGENRRILGPLHCDRNGQAGGPRASLALGEASNGVAWERGERHSGAVGAASDDDEGGQERPECREVFRNVAKARTVTVRTSPGFGWAAGC